MLELEVSTNQNKCDVELHGDFEGFVVGTNRSRRVKTDADRRGFMGPRCAGRVVDVAESDLTGGERLWT
jgi:hypothetical protein